jgi:16S rRNA pseudouridine516 synthase
VLRVPMRVTGANPAVLRLDRLLAESTGCSRSQARSLLLRSAVSVEGRTVRDAGFLVTPQCRVALEGSAVEWPREHYLMLHKPAGYECSSKSALHPLVSSLVPAPLGSRLHCAGRLDVDTTGLVLLTTDGQFSHAVTSPRRACLKTYLVTVRHPLDSTVPQRFAGGLQLRDEPRPTLPARLELLGPLQARLWLAEGRYHQVKRMFAACGNRVEVLHREAIGAVRLDPALAAGQWRELTADEVESLREA